MKATLLLEKLNATLLIYAYAVVLGALYLFAFWRPFGFSVFPLMDLGDYVSVPLNNVIVLIAVPFLAFFPILLPRPEVNLVVFKNGILTLIFIYGIVAIYYCISDTQLFLNQSFRYPDEIIVLLVSGILISTTGAITFLARASSHQTTHFSLLALALVLAQSSAVLGAG